jgi:hypothetical protein
MGEMKEGRGEERKFLGDNVENMSHFVFSRVIPSLILPPFFPRENVERLENWPRQDVENMSHFVFSRAIPSLILPPFFPRENVERLDNWPRQDFGKCLTLSSHVSYPSSYFLSPLLQRIWKD